MGTQTRSHRPVSSVEAIQFDTAEIEARNKPHKGQFVLKICKPNRARRLPRAPLRQMRRRFPRRAALRLPLLRGKGGVMASDIMLAVGDGAPKGQRKSPIGQTLGHPIRCPLGQTR